MPFANDLIARLLDGLPAATKKPFQDSKGQQRNIYEDGFALGLKEGDRAYLNNHVSMTIFFHPYPTDGVAPYLRIVGFEVVPERYAYTQLGYVPAHLKQH